MVDKRKMVVEALVRLSGLVLVATLFALWMLTVLPAAVVVALKVCAPLRAAVQPNDQVLRQIIDAAKLGCKAFGITDG
jgi:hypothetical protein